MAAQFLFWEYINGISVALQRDEWLSKRDGCQCMVAPPCHYNTLQRQNTEISKQIFPEKEYRGLSPNFHIHASVSDLYFPMIGLPILLEEYVD